MSDVDVRISGSQSVTPAADQARSSLQQLGDMIKKVSTSVFGQITLAGMARDAYHKLVEVVTSSIAAYREEASAMARLDGAMKAAGERVGMTREELNSLAESMMQTTRFGDDMVFNAEAILTTFDKIGGETFPQVIARAGDLAELLGTNLADATRTLGVALSDPEQGLMRLRRAGVVVDDQFRAMIKTMADSGDTAGAQAAILKMLEDRFGGIAQTVGQSAAGAMNKFDNAIEELKEAMGEGFVTESRPIIEWLTRVAFDAASASREIHAARAALDKLSEGKTVEKSSDLIAAYSLRAVELAQALQGAEANQNRLGGAGGAIVESIKAQIAEIRVLIAEQGRIQALQALGAKEGAAQAAQKQKEQADLALYLKNVDDAYKQTDEGAKEALLASMEYWENARLTAETTAPKVEAILKMLREKYKELFKETQEEKIVIDPVIPSVPEDVIVGNQQLEESTRKTEAAAKDARDAYDDFAKGVGRALGEGFVDSMEAIGEAMINAEDGMEALKEALKQTVATMIEMLGRYLLTMAGATFPLPISFAYLGGAAAAFVAAGVVRALEHGGWINEPVVGRGLRTGTIYTLAERESEYVGNREQWSGRGGARTTVFHVYGNMMREEEWHEASMRYSERQLRGY